MSNLLLEGFDDGLWNDRSTASSGIQTAQPTIGARTGANSRRYNAGSWWDRWTMPAADRHATFIVGFGYHSQQGSAPNSTNLLVLYGDDIATAHITVSVKPTGKIEILRFPSTLLGDTDTGVINVDKWHYIEVFVTLHDTTGVVKLRVDGKTPPGWSDLTSQDTKNGGTAAVFDTVHLGGSDLPFVDDVYINNGAGSENNDLMGDTRVWTLLANANGNYSQLNGSDGNQVDNYQQVDENPPVTSDYNGHATNANKDTYGMEDLTPTAGAVHAVQASIQALKSDSGAKSMRNIHRRNAVDSVGADHTLQLTADVYDEIWDLDPSDSAAWDITRVNASEFGAEVRA